MAITTLKQGCEIINESLHNLGYEYQIDTTNNTTMEDGLNKIGAYAPSQKNAIMEQMNLIIQQRNFGVMFDAEKNKFRSFLIDMTNEGFGVEDVFHELIEGIDPLWDDNTDETNLAIAKDLVSYDSNKIAKTFHTNDFARQFKTTIDRRNYEKVFTTTGVTRYVDTKLANLQWSAEVYLQNVAIDIVKEMIENNHIVKHVGHNINNKQGLLAMIEDIKSTVDGFITPTDAFNVGVFDDDEVSGFRPVVNITNSKDDIFIITTPENLERLKVHGYQNAYNLSEIELEGRIILAPNGTNFGTISTLDGDEFAQFIAVDRRALLMGIKLWTGGSFFAPNVVRTNNWLTLEGVRGYNTFFNAVAFFGEEKSEFDYSEGGGSSAGVNFNSVINTTCNEGFSLAVKDDEGNTLTMHSYDKDAVWGDVFYVAPSSCKYVDVEFGQDITGTVKINGETVSTISNPVDTIRVAIPAGSLVDIAYTIYE